MTTATEIITQAFREANITPIGRTPTDAEFGEALPRLNNFIAWLFGSKLGEFVMDWPVPPNRQAPVAADFPLGPHDKSLPDDVWPYPPNNVRLLASITAATTIYLPFQPNPGARLALSDVGATANLTINANGRLIEGTASITLDPVDATGRHWFYRDDIASWSRVDALELEDESPLPVEFDDLLITALAMRLAPRFGQEVLRSTMQVYDGNLKRMDRKYAQYMPKTSNFDPILLSRQAHQQGYWHGDDSSLYGY